MVDKQKIEELFQLKQKGIITEEQFNTKKAELLKVGQDNKSNSSHKNILYAFLVLLIILILVNIFSVTLSNGYIGEITIKRYSDKGVITESITVAHNCWFRSPCVKISSSEAERLKSTSCFTTNYCKFLITRLNDKKYNIKNFDIVSHTVF